MTIQAHQEACPEMTIVTDVALDPTHRMDMMIV